MRIYLMFEADGHVTIRRDEVEARKAAERIGSALLAVEAEALLTPVGECEHGHAPNYSGREYACAYGHPIRMG